VNDPGLVIDKPVKLVGDENNPSNVVIEMSGSIQWLAKGGWIEGITFRRPKISSGTTPSCPMLEVKDAGRIDMIQSVFDNDGSTGSAVVLSGIGNKGKWDGVTVRNGGMTGISMSGQISVEINRSVIKGNQADGIKLSEKASIKITNGKISKNKGYGIRFASGCKGTLLKSHFFANDRGVICKESHVNITSSTNTAVVPSLPEKQIPGFKLTLESDTVGTLADNNI
jgi:hypothetical protein